MVQKVKTKSSKELFDNRNDESRVYDIEAVAHVEDSKVGDIGSGRVYIGETHVADFNTWDVNNMNVTFIGVQPEERGAINEAINTFIAELKAVVTG